MKTIWSTKRRKAAIIQMDVDSPRCYKAANQYVCLNKKIDENTHTHTKKKTNKNKQTPPPPQTPKQEANTP